MDAHPALRRRRLSLLARSDDGVRIWLDNWLVTDQWYDGGAGLRSGDFQGVGAGEHTVRIEYYEGQGDAFATIWWERTGPITEWKGEYFTNTNLDDVPGVGAQRQRHQLQLGQRRARGADRPRLLLGPLDAQAELRRWPVSLQRACG
ncbi:PA14 domain-containing protein [Candidatus Amarolinea dominans]|uniref:PA14 domain-containing protein n=1 Tax=Candidatus Amarolinea dominans TaxID=3140696 RepID=UPI0031CCCFAC